MLRKRRIKRRAKKAIKNKIISHTSIHLHGKKRQKRGELEEKRVGGGDGEKESWSGGDGKREKVREWEGRKKGYEILIF